MSAHTHTYIYTNVHSTQVESDNLEIIYSDGQYEYISGDPQLSGNSSDQESMEDNLVYVFSESGQEVETSPTKKEDFRVNRNDSYQPVNEEFHALNLYNWRSCTLDDSLIKIPAVYILIQR